MSFTPGNNSDTRLTSGEKASRRVSPWLKFGAPAAFIAIVLIAVLGGVLGSRAANKSSNKSNTAAGDASSSASSSASKTSSAAKSTSTQTSSGASASASASAAAATGGNVTITPLKAWDWSTDKAIGMCLGNWLILERWMNEDWFIATAGANAWDEWDFTETLGTTAATTALQAHFSTWITEADIEIMYQNGINQLRIPTGFWAWIPTVSGEPYIDAGQKDQLELAMGWAHARGMYVIIDAHGLPGSQNGEESSGHNTTDPAWFGNTVNQGRSDTMVLAILDFIANTPYRSTVAGFEVINEPRPYTAEQDVELSDYYTRSYAAIQASAYPVTMFIHGAFITDAMDYWLSFVSARVTVPPSLVYEDHPYPGNFPPQTDSASILAQVCTDATGYLGYPVPVVVTEWSVYTGIKTMAFETTFYESQAKTWAWSGGAHYWSYKLIPSSIQLAAGLDYSQYSFITLVQNATDTIPTASSANVENTTTAANANTYLDSLTGNCGTAPSNVSPYNNGSLSSSPWAAESSALASAATVTLKATGTAGSRVRRSFRG